MAIKKVVSATRAVAFALAQVGKGYAWAGTGPKFDCSGLVMMAWEQGGLAMPHNSAAQADYHQNPYVTTVPATAANKRRLVPGDLVFYYPGITHVAMYTDRVGVKKLRYVVQATDDKHGVEHIWMFAYAKPVSYGFVNHI